MNRACLSPAVLWSLARESVEAWSDDFAPSMGAGIAYYTVFSIAPLLIIVVAVAGLFSGTEAVGGYVHAQLADLLGPAGAEVVREMVASASNTGEGLVATTVGTVLLVIGATTVFAELQSDLDRIWEVPAPKSEGILRFIRKRLLSLGLVVSVGFLMLVSLVSSAVLAALGKWWGGMFEDIGWVLRALDLVLGLGLTTVLFALMYKILPRARIAWHDVWIGAFATAVLFSLGKFLISTYIGRSSVASSFGTAGSLVVLLVWVYYSAQIFLLGAEFTWVYARRYGSRCPESQPGAALLTPGSSVQRLPPSRPHSQSPVPR